MPTPTATNQCIHPAAETGAAPSSWPTTRILFLLAGALTVSGTLLSARVNRWFGIIPAVVGANQLLFVTIGRCPASMVIERLRGRTGGAATSR